MHASTTAALLCAILAGIMNGSFALPTKHIQNWRFENIWFNYGLWGFLLLPWISIFALDPHVLSIYRMTPPYTLVILIMGGALFGAGQVCFALALRIIGFGLGFIINIGLGTGLGFLLPLITQHADQILTPFGLSTVFGTILISIGLALSYRAGRQREANVNIPHPKHKISYQVGVLLAVIAGLFSAGQNLTFALTGNLQQLALAAGTQDLAAAIIIWPPFLTCTFIPYGCYMLYLHAKQGTFRNYRQPGSVKSALLTAWMGILWYTSLTLYSKSALWIGELGPVVAWPLFMVFIILTANFWGYVHKEWAGCDAKTIRKALAAMVFLVLAVVVLAYSATL